MKKSSCYLIIIFSLLVIATSASANNAIVFDGNTHSYTHSEKINYFQDTTDTLDAYDAANLSNDSWQALPEKVANFGFPEGVFWFKFDLSNVSSRTSEIYVHINYALLDQITLYSFIDGKLVDQISTGDTTPYHSRPVDYSTFLLPLTLEQNQTKQILLRVETQGSMQVPISIWKKEFFLLEKQQFLFLYGCFIAVILVMAVYNLCLFVFIRDKSYLYYTIFAISLACLHSSFDGLAYQWLWPNLPDWHQISTITLVPIGCFTCILFTQALLPISNIKSLNTFANITKLTSIIGVALVFLLPYRDATLYNSFNAIICMSGVLLICLSMLKDSPRVARLYTLSWTFYFFGMLLKTLSKMGVVPYSLLAEYIGNAGAVTGFIILSLALADRINSERRAKVKAQHQAMNYLQRFENLYQNALEGIFSFDETGVLIDANPAFTSLTGIKAGQNVSDLDNLQGYHVHPAEFKTFNKAIAINQKVIDFELQLHNSEGKFIWVNISARFMKGSPNNKKLIEGTLVDITERKAFENKLKHLAERDPLTGIRNRRAFQSEVSARIEEIKHYETPCCLMFLDLDRFRMINDLCGHTAGDKLLKQLSECLENKLHEVHKDSTIARLGGDEFGILVKRANLGKARVIAEAMRKTIEAFLFIWEGKRFTIGVSIGLVQLSALDSCFEELLKKADSACYQAKNQGRNRIQSHLDTDDTLIKRQQEVLKVHEIKQAIADDRFVLMYQNIADNFERTDRYHYEILVRMIDLDGQLCSPNQFIPTAERYDLMPKLDRWVIEHFFCWLKENPDHNAKLACASINITAQSLGEESFEQFLFSMIKKYQISPNKICFEITEGMAITHLESTVGFIKKFRNLGFRFALDDFGTGFSSYSYLKDLDLDYVKIDGIFVKNINTSTVDYAMVKSIGEVAQAMGIKTVAEFVEDEEIRSRLIRIGIDYSQGYLVSQPERLDQNNFKYDPLYSWQRKTSRCLPINATG